MTASDINREETPDPLDFDLHELANIDERPTALGFSGKRLQTVSAVMGSVGFLLFGYDQAVMGSLLTLPSFRHNFPEIDTVTHTDNHTSTIQGFVIAVYELGCLAGALINYKFNNRYGRLKAIFLGCVLMTIGATIQCSAFSLAQFIVGRIITGVGNGFNTSTIPVYTSESASRKLRGKLMMIYGGVNTVGVALAYWLDFAFYYVHNSADFRFPIAFQILFPLIIIPLISFLPESPRWLARNGRFVDSARSFAAFMGTSVNDPVVAGEVDRVRQSLVEERELGRGLTMRQTLFHQGPHRNLHRLLLGMGSQILQQLTGINLVTYYAGTIFEQYIGMSPVNSRILAACNGTEYFMFTFTPFFTIERWGRRSLMMTGSVFECFSMVMLTVFTTLAHKGINSSGMGVGATVMLFVFNSAFGYGWLAMTWLLPAELTPLSIRASANALSTAANWSFNFMVVMITPVAFNNIGSYTYLIFGVLNFFTIPIVYLFYPETKGRSLEEMDLIFGQCPVSKPWEVVEIAKRMPYEKKRAIVLSETSSAKSFKLDQDIEKATVGEIE